MIYLYWNMRIRESSWGNESQPVYYWYTSKELRKWKWLGGIHQVHSAASCNLCLYLHLPGIVTGDLHFLCRRCRFLSVHFRLPYLQRFTAEINQLLFSTRSHVWFFSLSTGWWRYCTSSTCAKRQCIHHEEEANKEMLHWTLPRIFLEEVNGADRK